MVLQMHFISDMDNLHNTCAICRAEFQDMTEPCTTSCGHPYCWPCIYMVSLFDLFGLIVC